MLFTDISYRRAVKALEKAGFWVSRQSGKHAGMTDGRRKVVVPRHARLNPYTLKGIVRDAGLTDDEFKRLLK